MTIQQERSYSATSRRSTPVFAVYVQGVRIAERDTYRSADALATTAIRRDEQPCSVCDERQPLASMDAAGRCTACQS